MKLPRWISRRLRALPPKVSTSRKPDICIGGEADPYLRRWFVIPRNPVFNIYLHHFCRSDDDRALHDHPWLFNCSIVLSSGYHEHLPPLPDGRARAAVRVAGDLVFRWGKAPHRVQLWKATTTKEEPAWTLFITGPRVREWGFYCPQGWRHWREFTAGKKGELVGKGCD